MGYHNFSQKFYTFLSISASVVSLMPLPPVLRDKKLLCVLTVLQNARNPRAVTIKTRPQIQIENRYRVTVSPLIR